MERIAIVMSHASRSMGGAVRDVHLAAGFRARGVDARLYRIHAGTEVEEDRMLGVPLTFCPSDNPDEIPHRQTSAALRAAVAAFAPDAVLYKGLGYRVNADLQAGLPERVRIGLVVGGAVQDPLLPRASLVLGEYREQLARCFLPLWRAGRALVLPKHVDLALAGSGVPPEAPEFDIVNVGTFAEPRKNQAALLPLAERHSVAFVGAGPLLAAQRRQTRGRHKAHYLGRLPHPEVFGVLRRSAIMVHASTMDGLPRATVEAMACGLPVVALHATIDGGIPPTAGLLVSPEGLRPAAELLLADPALRLRMGRAARRHVETHHGPRAIDAAAERALGVLRGG
ncbi:glycosyltransferase family 4 protein [Falsiroseomonas sp. CW058]|uniref:glycosyltransferase family 4 protein n=1 Tax=Falsiroseomonas sp. CW058 TaxID=3388664 RepID=UPI003D30F23F